MGLQGITHQTLPLEFAQHLPGLIHRILLAAPGPFRSILDSEWRYLVSPATTVLVKEHEQIGDSLADLTRVLLLLIIAVVARSYLTDSHVSQVERATPAPETESINEAAPSADLMDHSTVGF